MPATVVIQGTLLVGGPFRLVAMVLEPDLHLRRREAYQRGKMFALRCGEVALLPKPALQLVRLRLGEQDAPFALLVPHTALLVAPFRRHAAVVRVLDHVDHLIVTALFDVHVVRVFRGGGGGDGGGGGEGDLRAPSRMGSACACRIRHGGVRMRDHRLSRRFRSHLRTLPTSPGRAGDYGDSVVSSQANDDDVAADVADAPDAAAGGGGGGGGCGDVHGEDGRQDALGALRDVTRPDNRSGRVNLRPVSSTATPVTLFGCPRLRSFPVDSGFDHPARLPCLLPVPFGFFPPDDPRGGCHRHC
uniref:Uncharacterized protein n=1 Tax=Anopheles farauti TaxID=69004 RepID=A0A182QQ85_9DIPT